MSFIKKILCMTVTVLVIVTLAGNAFASGTVKNDTDNHIACDNSDNIIPTDGPARLDESDGWIRVEGNMLTNFYSMYQPEVIYIPEWDVEGGYPYMMWFFAWAYNQENDPKLSDGYEGLKTVGEDGKQYGGDLVFCARAKSVEGPWEVYSNKGNKVGVEDEFYWDTEMDPFYWYPVIFTDDTWLNSWHIGDPSVVYKDGTLYMALSSMGCDEDMIPAHKSGDTDGNMGCIVGATSKDGINWTVSEKPLIIWENEKGFNENVNGGVYYGGHQRPSIMFDDGIWKMWYDFRGNQIGYAECNGDFITGTWKERVSNTAKGLLDGVDFDVVKIGDIYYAYGDPYVNWVGIKDRDIPYYGDDANKWSQRQIVEYRSYDGIEWTPTGYFLPDEGYDANQIPQVFLDHKQNRVYIFYATQRGKRQSSNYDWRWDNIRCMYRDVELFANDGSATATTTPTEEITTAPTDEITVAPTIESSVAPTAEPSADIQAPSAKKTGAGPIVLLISSVIAAILVVGSAILSRRRR